MSSIGEGGREGGRVGGTYLPAPTLSVLGSLDDTRQVQHLYLSPSVVERAGHGGERCELFFVGVAS